MEFDEIMFLNIFKEINLEKEKEDIIEFVNKNRLINFNNYETFMSHPYFTKVINKYNEINNTNIKIMEDVLDLCIINEQNKIFNSFMSIEKSDTEILNIIKKEWRR